MIEKYDIIKSIVRLLFESPECEAKEDEESDTVLVHELGHVIVAEMLEPGSVGAVSVESHNGSVGGVTIICPTREKKTVAHNHGTQSHLDIGWKSSNRDGIRNT